MFQMDIIVQFDSLAEISFLSSAMLEAFHNRALLLGFYYFYDILFVR